MKIVEILGKNYRGAAAHTRIACRGVVYVDGKILLSHEPVTGWYLIPGGGLENNESMEDCCIRELREETGWQVTPPECFLTLKECYGDWCYITHYFRCEPVFHGSSQLTESEAQRGLVPEWVDFAQAEAIFADHINPAHDEEKRGSYLREYRALDIFRQQYL